LATKFCVQAFATLSPSRIGSGGVLARTEPRKTSSFSGSALLDSIADMG
jgi:hypothetical protein